MSKPELPRFIQLSSALQEFATVEGTQAQQHIRPLHQYLTVRLVLEGGFDPGEITPHPPLRVERKGQRKLLSFASDRTGRLCACTWTTRKGWSELALPAECEREVCQRQRAFIRRVSLVLNKF